MQISSISSSTTTTKQQGQTGAASAFDVSSYVADASQDQSSAQKQISSQGTYLNSSLIDALNQSSKTTSIINPADWLTDADKQLVKQETGLTVKDGKTYDESGNEVETQAASDLISALYEIHQNQAIDGSNPTATTITADDLQAYIASTETLTGSMQHEDTAVLDKAIQDLRSDASKSTGSTS